MFDSITEFLLPAEELTPIQTENRSLDISGDTWKIEVASNDTDDVNQNCCGDRVSDVMDDFRSRTDGSWRVSEYLTEEGDPGSCEKLDSFAEECAQEFDPVPLPILESRFKSFPQSKKTMQTVLMAKEKLKYKLKLRQLRKAQKLMKKEYELEAIRSLKPPENRNSATDVNDQSDQLNQIRPTAGEISDTIGEEPSLPNHFAGERKRFQSVGQRHYSVLVADTGVSADNTRLAHRNIEEEYEREQSALLEPGIHTPLVESLNEVELLQMIGFGTFGKIHLGRHRTSGKALAVKVLEKDFIAQLKQEEHVCQEAGLLGEIDHPFVNHLHASFQDWNHLYLVLELVNGGDLYSLVSELTRLTEAHTIFLTAQLVSVFTFIHSHNIAFRDLNTTNVMIGVDGYLQVIDWGFAKVIPSTSRTFCGTPAYLPPEIIDRKPHSLLVDVWSLGILVFELLCGHTPYHEIDSQHTLQLYAKIRKGVICFPEHVNPLFQDAITQMCEIDTAKRITMILFSKHAIFEGMDWKALIDKDIPAPCTPQVDGPFDVSILQKGMDLTDTEGESDEETESEPEESEESAHADEELSHEDIALRLAALEENEYSSVFKPTIDLII